MVNRFFDGLHAHRPLLQRPQDASAQLVFVERLAGAVGLDDAGHHQLGHLEGGKTLVTEQTLTTAAHLMAFCHQTGIDHLGINRTTEWAMHRTSGVNGTGTGPAGQDLGRPV